MKDRTATDHSAPIPMPGSLGVAFFDLGRQERLERPLHEVAHGTQVTATGTVTHFRPIPGGAGRVHVTLTDDAGNWALVDCPPRVAAQVRPYAHGNLRVAVTGVVQSTPNLPAGLLGHQVRPEVAGGSQ